MSLELAFFVWLISIAVVCWLWSGGKNVGLIPYAMSWVLVSCRSSMRVRRYRLKKIVNNFSILGS